MTAKAGYFWDGRLIERKTGLGCPEAPERCQVLAPNNVLAGTGPAAMHCAFESRDLAILKPVYDAQYIEKVRGAHGFGLRFLDAGETRGTPDLFPQALLSASAGVQALDRIINGELAAAFCAVRPPGHHAYRCRALGVCVFNNVAVAAAYARERHGVKSVMIVDWDVHPGNGTQEIFWDDPNVFTLSIHQADLLSESGQRELVGRGAGEGFSRNEPVPAGIEPSEYLNIFRNAVEEVAAGFRPELLLISAGFDAHQRDPASRMRLEEEHFAEMTGIALRAAQPFTRGRTLSLLEGGYNLHALQNCVSAHFRKITEFCAGLNAA